MFKDNIIKQSVKEILCDTEWVQLASLCHPQTKKEVIRPKTKSKVPFSKLGSLCYTLQARTH